MSLEQELLDEVKKAEALVAAEEADAVEGAVENVAEPHDAEVGADASHVVADVEEDSSVATQVTEDVAEVVPSATTESWAHRLVTPVVVHEHPLHHV